jgi:signal transduction histidine kinase
MPQAHHTLQGLSPLVRHGYDVVLLDLMPGRGSGYLLAGRRWIAEAHDGEIHVVSEVGVGTRVTLDLPVA